MTTPASSLPSFPSDLASGVNPEQVTDSRWAERFALAHADVLRFPHALDYWLVYRAPLWRRDLDGEIVRRAIAFARTEQLRAVETIDDMKAREAAVKYAIGRESKQAIDRCLSLARSMRPLADTGEGWDSEPFLLGTPTTIVDLTTGQPRPADPSLRVTRSTAVAYRPGALCPRWRQFLEEVFDNDRTLIGFVQRFVGYALSASVIEQVFLLCYGTGANGKSVFLSTLAYVFGEYAVNLPFSALEQRGRSSIPNDVAQLVGRRLATASETSEGVRLNEARLKALTGGDTISARFLYRETFQFTPTAHFMLAVNHKPVISDDSTGFWRRLLLLPFLRSFTGSACDPHLEERLRHEGPGILQWAIEGCLAWQREGLNPPAKVRQETDAYRDESDPLADFLIEAMDFDLTARASASAVQDAYTKWCDLRGITKQDRLNARALSQRLADRFERRKTNTGWTYEGVRIATNRLFE